MIEVDGYSHEYTAEYDARRDKYLTGLGLQVVHLLDSNIKHTLDSVMIYLNGLFESIATRSPPCPLGHLQEGNSR